MYFILHQVVTVKVVSIVIPYISLKMDYLDDEIPLL